jgi:hypothetical protein
MGYRLLAFFRLPTSDFRLLDPSTHISGLELALLLNPKMKFASITGVRQSI